MVLEYRSASPAYWVTILLPLGIILSDPSPFLLIFSMSVIYNTAFLTYLQFYSHNITVTIEKIKAPYIFISLITFGALYFLKYEPYSVFTFISLTFAFPYVFYNLIKYYPKSFTFGEGIIVTQAFILVFFNCFKNVPNPPDDLKDDSNAATYLAQVGILGVMILTRLIVISMKPWTFLFTEEFFCVWGKCCLASLSFRLSLEELWGLLTWTHAFFSSRVMMLSYWLSCLLGALFVVYWKNSECSSSKVTTTVDRKYFHFLIVAVYLPGILYDPHLLYIASAAVMYLFFILELTRCLKFKIFESPIGEMIEESVGVFRDSKDEGKLIVTPIYLLAGISLPLWLIGLNKLENYESFQLAAALSGIFSIGIGDTFASIGGTAYGKIKWRDSNKSFGGTMCCLFSQLALLTLLNITGLCQLSGIVNVSVIVAAVVNSIIEALTDQIDNLILPLVTYDIILAFKIISQITMKSIN